MNEPNSSSTHPYFDHLPTTSDLSSPIVSTTEPLSSRSQVRLDDAAVKSPIPGVAFTQKVLLPRLALHIVSTRRNEFLETFVSCGISGRGYLEARFSPPMQGN